MVKFSRRQRCCQTITWLFLLMMGVSVAAAASPLRIAVPVDPQTLDPRFATRAWSVKISELIFEGLLAYDAHFHLVPSLAQSFEQVSPTLYRFHLRPDAVFHTGQPLKSRDVQFTLESILDPTQRSPLRQAFEKIKAVRTPDDQTVEIELREPHAPILASFTIGIVPESEARKENFSVHPVGTGPFQITGWESERWVRLSPVRDRTLPDLEFRILRDDTVRVLEFLKGNLDLVQNAVPPILVPAVTERKPQTQVIAVQGTNYTYLGLRLTEAHLQDRRVRQALAHAVDRDALLHYKLKDFGEPASGLLAPEHWAAESDVQRYDFNPRRAKELLDEAGFPDPDGEGPKKRFSLVFKCSTGKNTRELVMMIARYLEAVGIGIKLRSAEEGVFARDLEQGNFDIFARTWTGINEPDLLAVIFHSNNIPPQGANRGFYKNPQVDAWLEKAQTTSDLAERKRYYSEVQKTLAIDLPYISLWHEKNVALLSERVSGYEPDAVASFRNLAHTKVNP